VHIVWPREIIVEMTRLYTGERFPDGRPKVPDDILDRMRTVSSEEAWGTLRNLGYVRQFVGGWMETHPGRVLVGRAVTAIFLPHRPDLHDLVQETGVAEGRGNRGGQNSWVINTLELRDVMVVDMFGKVEGGPFVGDNLTTSIRNRTGTGAVIEGTVRDHRGIAAMPDINIFCRGLHPSFIMDVTLGGINLPMRIENVTVLPGDVVLGTPTGVVFIPAHLAQAVVERAEEIMQRDAFSRERLTAGVYTPGEIDVPEWTANIEEDFQRWRAARTQQ